MTDTTTRTLSCRINVAVTVELRHDEDGIGEIVNIIHVNAGPSAADIYDALDAAGALQDLDREEPS